MVGSNHFAAVDGVVNLGTLVGGVANPVTESQVVHALRGRV